MASEALSLYITYADTWSERWYSQHDCKAIMLYDVFPSASIDLKEAISKKQAVGYY